LLNGFEKFGKRYEELGLWSRAAEFYARAYAGQQARTDLLEKVATTWQTAGDDVQYRKYARELLERTLTPEQKSSPRVAEQLSLANSYREVGDTAKASEHLDLARQRAAEEALERPTDPEAAYTLGMVYEVMADYGKAREYYDRARTLLPAEEKYGSGYQRVDAYLKKTP
jgi:tetratricopeptide (TPR) repeat protein